VAKYLYKPIISLLLFQIVFNAYGQRLKIEVGFGWGTYSMKDLKKLNESLLNSYPVDPAITDDFPSGHYYYTTVSYAVNQNVSLGLVCNYNSTGSRINYKDYSGELKFDNIVSCYSPGLQAEFNLSSGKHFRLSQETNISFLFTKLKIREEILGQDNQLIFNSQSFGIEPGFVLSYIFKRIELSTKVGYLLDTKGKNKLKSNKDIILKDISTHEVVKNNWSGTRVSFSLGVLL
jgi:hypothetical protein